MLQIERKKILIGMTVDELRNICKENGVSYYEHGKRLNKGRMIDKLLEYEVYVEEVSKEIEEEKKKNEPFELPNETKEEIEEAERLKRRKQYVEQAKVGIIIAFRLPDGKVISAMITKKSTSRRMFKVETQYGVEYRISFDDVIWVRTHKRWPKGIYQLFKKNNKLEVTEDGKEIS